MNKESKTLNLIFRMAIFITFVLTSVSISLFIYYMLQIGMNDGNGHYETFTKLFDKLLMTFKMYDVMLVATIICFVMSLATRYRSTAISFVTRTVLLGAAVFYQFKGRAIPNSFVKILTIMDDAGIHSFGASESEFARALENSGYSSEDAEAFAATIEDEEKLYAMVIAYIVTMTVLFLLAITSIHSLVKRDTVITDLQPGTGLNPELMDEKAGTVSNTEAYVYSLQNEIPHRAEPFEQVKEVVIQNDYDNNDNDRFNIK